MRKYTSLSQQKKEKKMKNLKVKNEKVLKWWMVRVAGSWPHTGKIGRRTECYYHHIFLIKYHLFLSIYLLIKYRMLLSSYFSYTFFFRSNQRLNDMIVIFFLSLYFRSDQRLNDMISIFFLSNYLKIWSKTECYYLHIFLINLP